MIQVNEVLPPADVQDRTPLGLRVDFGAEETRACEDMDSRLNPQGEPQEGIAGIGRAVDARSRLLVIGGLVDGGISADEAFRLASAPLNELGAIVAHVSDRDVLSPEVEIMPAPQISEALLRVAGNVGPLALPAALRAGIAGVILGDELDRLKDKPTDIYRPIRTFTHQNYDPSAGPVDRSVFIYDNFGGQADNGVNYYDHRILSSTRLDPSLGSIVFAMPETSALEIAHRDDPGAPSAYPFGGKDVGPIGMEVRYPGPVRETLGFYLASELSDEGLVVSLSHGYWNAVLGVEGVAKVLWLHRYAREHAARSVDS